MELQRSVNTSTNFPPVLGAPGPRERLESTAEQAVVAPKSAAKRPFIDNEFVAPRPANDYSSATDDDVLVSA